jgi:Cu2+-exporting ATPase
MPCALTTLRCDHTHQDRGVFLLSCKSLAAERRGSGTDVAIESAGIILVRSNPLDVVKIFELSRASYRKMIQNLLWATSYNVIALPLAAGVLAWAGILLSPAVGAVLMSFSTIVVAINAQLLRGVQLSDA